VQETHTAGADWSAALAASPVPAPPLSTFQHFQKNAPKENTLLNLG